MPERRLGPYRILESLGSGATATVHLAEVVTAAPGLEVGDPVALKVIHPHLMEGGAFRTRLRREVEMGMSVRHPNVVRTHGYTVVEDGDETTHIITMEFVEGQTLRRFLEEEERCDEPLCHHIGREISAGLTAVHAAGIIHRDVKPENVMITKDETIKVMDLGMARLKDEAFRLSEPGDFVGTVLYSAPEQFLRGGEEVDGRADLYALGLILYELITGSHALGAGGEPGAVMRRQIRTMPPPPSRKNPQISPFFEELIMRLLLKDRSERFASAEALKDVLEAGESCDWWRQHSETLRGKVRRPLRRIRIPRETAQYGRDGEMERLRERWRRTRAGEGQVVLVEGEAGIGKTRLVDELVSDLTREYEDLNFLYGAYPPGGAATASGALATAFREHLGVENLDVSLSRHLKSTPGLAPRLAAWLRGEPLPGAGRVLERNTLETLEGLFVRLLRSIATDGPTLLCVDDLHFAPPEARAIFAALTHALASDPVLLVATYRPEIPEDWLATVERQTHVSRLRLSRLGARDLQLLLTDALLSEQSAEHLGGAVAVKSDGNPFFVFEILKSLKEKEIVTLASSGVWERTGEIRDLVIPDSMKDLTRARIAELSESDRELLDVAACCGFSFDPVLVGEVLRLGRIPTLKRFTHIQRRFRLVHAKGREFVFDHYQVREALYESLSELLREEYHAVIAEVLIDRMGGAPADEVPGPVGVSITAHMLDARRGRTVLPWLMASLENLAAAYDFVTLLDLSEKALARPGLLSGEYRVEALMRKGAACQLLGRWEAGTETWQEAVEIVRGLPDLGLRVVALVQYAAFQCQRGAFRDAHPVVREAVRVARRIGEADREALAWNISGIVLFNLGLARAAEAHLRKSLLMARECGERDVEAKNHATLARIAQLRGRSEEAREHNEEAIRIFRETGHKMNEAIAVGIYGAWFFAHGRFEEAREKYEEHRRLSRAIGYRRGELKAESNLGSLHFAQGRFEEARRSFERDHQLNTESGDTWGMAQSAGNLAETLAALGEFKEARELWQTALPVFDDQGDRLWSALAVLHLARIAESLGDDELAVVQYERAIALLRKLDAQSSLTDALVNHGRLLRNSGRGERARARFEEALALSRSADLLPGSVLATAYLAGSPDVGAEPALEALERFGDHVNLLERMEARYEVFLATGDRRLIALASETLDGILDRLPPARRDRVAGAVPLYRRIREAAAGAA